MVGGAVYSSHGLEQGKNFRCGEVGHMTIVPDCSINSSTIFREAPKAAAPVLWQQVFTKELPSANVHIVVLSV